VGSHNAEDQLTDARLDREIAEALAVDPSPEYLPRVRAAVAEQASRAGWRLPWMWVGAGTAALAMGLAVAVYPTAVTERPPVPDPPRAGGLPARPSPPDAPVSLPRQVPSRARARSGAAKPAVEARAPEVLIAREESAALRRLMHGVRHGMVEPADVEPAVSDVQAGGPPSAVLVLPMPAIPPVAIAPLELEEGEQQ
jgi:hypothetical protein